MVFGEDSLPCLLLQNNSMDRGRKGLSPSPLRTVPALLPHTALQSVVSSSGWACPLLGFLKGAKPLRHQEGLRPTRLVFRGPTQARTFVPLPQERPEASTAKAIDV